MGGWITRFAGIAYGLKKQPFFLFLWSRLCTTLLLECPPLPFPGLRSNIKLRLQAHLELRLQSRLSFGHISCEVEQRPIQISINVVLVYLFCLVFYEPNVAAYQLCNEHQTTCTLQCSLNLRHCDTAQLELNTIIRSSLYVKGGDLSS